MSSPSAAAAEEKPGDAMLMAMWAEWHDGAVAMATNDELSLEWSMLSEDYYSWDDTDLQLAAELGKTLLERNKELETGLKHQQTVIDDQSQEIEYLSKQSGALREVNDSRLRVYEQLEVSIQELESTNQRLSGEATRDKKRIRSLCQTVESLEARTAELQTQLDELRDAEHARKAAETSHQHDRCCSPLSQGDSHLQSRLEEVLEQVASLEKQLLESRGRERSERESRRTLELELNTAQEESSELRQEMALLRERSVKLHSLAEEVHAMEESRLSPFLRQCTAAPARVSSSSPQMSAPSPHELQRAAASTPDSRASPAHPPQHSVWGPQSVVWPKDDTSSPPDKDPAACSARDQPLDGCCGDRLTPQPPSPQHPVGSAHHLSAPASLISDLDAHYRVLLDEMDKYEWMLSSRQPRAVSPQPQPSSLSLLQELQMTTDGRPASGHDELRMPSLEGSHVALRDSGPDSLMLIGGDGDASSSGFSEGSSDSRTVSRATQTLDGISVPTAMANVMVASSVQMTTPSRVDDTVDVTPKPGHIPQYKQLFQEIFEVLKRPPVIRVGNTAASIVSPPSASTAVSSTSCLEDPEIAALQNRRTVSPLPYRSPSRHEPLAPSPSLMRTSPAENEPALNQQPICPTRTFSYTQEFEKCLQKASAEVAAASPIHAARKNTVCGKGGAGDRAIDGDTDSTVEEPIEDFPHLARPSEEVAKLWILERSYAEALKAGRRCLHRPTLL